MRRNLLGSTIQRLHYRGRHKFQLFDFETVNELWQLIFTLLMIFFVCLNYRLCVVLADTRYRLNMYRVCVLHLNFR